ncbi:MAG: Hsp70 family protein, partial [Candidatus Aminicenantes bacterium]|nr:Hsp70 family protein [Candidatus Aminicenantes bacterium]
MKTISIDLGTYNSAVAYRTASGEVRLAQAYHGPTFQGSLVPSFLKFLANGELEKYGELAREEVEVFPQLVVWGLKRLLGKSYQDAREEFSRFHYPLREAEDGSIEIPIGNRVYTPIEQTALFLRKIKDDCENRALNPELGGPIERAIITHPAYFDCGQRAAIKEAALGDQVGFKSVEMISEPEAAALAYRDFIDFSQRPLVMVIDWGAGTLDIVILRFSLDEKGQPIVDSVYAPYGDTQLGGIDMDDVLLKRGEIVLGLTDVDSVAEAKLRFEIERLKIRLSSTSWEQRFYSLGSKGYSLKFARKKGDVAAGENEKEWVFLEETLAPILRLFRDKLEASLDKHGLTPDIIDGLLLVGGPMYMPCVRGVVRDVFKDNPAVIAQLERWDTGFPVSPLEAVARGALLKDIVMGDIGNRTPYAYGFMLDDKILPRMIIEENTIVPNTGIHKESDIFTCRSGHVMQISLYKR